MTLIKWIFSIKLPRSRQLALITIIAAWFVGCGVKDSPHYKDPKHYGEKQLEEEDTNTPELEEGDIGGDTGKIEQPEADTLVEEQIFTYDTVVYKANFRGTLDLAHASLLRNDMKSLKTEESDLSSLLESLFSLSKGPTDEANPPLFSIGHYLLDVSPSPAQIIAEQNYGDGTSRSTLVQEIFASWLPRQKIITDRTTSVESCPNVFACIDRFVIDLQKGKDYTVCFYDPVSFKPTAVPFGVNFGLDQEQVQPYTGNYGPYLVYKYYRRNVDCANPHPHITKFKSGKKYEAQKVMAKIRILPPLKEESFASLDVGLPENRIDYGVEFGFTLLNREHDPVDLQRESYGERKLRYIDDVTGLQESTRYYINEEYDSLVKTVKTFRISSQLFDIDRLFNAASKSEMKMAAKKSKDEDDERSYFDFSGITEKVKGQVEDLKNSAKQELVDTIIGQELKDKLRHDGIKIDFHAEFCRDLLDEKAVIRCSGG